MHSSRIPVVGARVRCTLFLFAAGQFPYVMMTTPVEDVGAVAVARLISATAVIVVALVASGRCLGEPGALNLVLKGLGSRMDLRQQSGRHRKRDRGSK